MFILEERKNTTTRILYVEVGRDISVMDKISSVYKCKIKSEEKWKQGTNNLSS